MPKSAAISSSQLLLQYLLAIEMIDQEAAPERRSEAAGVNPDVLFGARHHAAMPLSS
jgi:hypothetical protein